MEKRRRFVIDIIQVPISESLIPDTNHCEQCGSIYSTLPGECVSSFWEWPTDYQRGVMSHCLGCWLGVPVADMVIG